MQIMDKTKMLEGLIRHYTKGNKAQFAKLLGVSAQTISAWIARNTFDAELIYAKCRCIDSSWLLTGEGEMLKNSPSYKEKNKKSIDKEEKVPEVSYNPAIGKPYYDVDFLGGFNEIVNSQVTIPTNNIVIQGFEKADFWCNVTGHSMEPKINHGDIIALHKCTLEDIQYGEIYAVVLDTLRTIKILRRSSDPKKLRFVPINTTDYDEQEYPVERITNVFEVIGSISKFF